MAKHKALSALDIAYVTGFVMPTKTTDGNDIRYGRKAIVGQYTKPYTRVVEQPEGTRISKGRRKRYIRDHGTEGRLDYAAVINARQ